MNQRCMIYNYFLMKMALILLNRRNMLKLMIRGHTVLLLNTGCKRRPRS